MTLASPVMRRAIVALCTLVVFASAPAAAQNAPAGNAHPQSQAVSSGTGFASPFGEPDWSGFNAAPTEEQRRAAAETKARFARSVDLKPLRDLAVFHSGRVKILDTLARETVRRIAGRRDYQELTPRVDAEGRLTGVDKQPFDPLFTLLDLMIDPAHYLDRPLIHVEYLPLRTGLVEAATTDPAARERWMKLTRLSPRIVGMHGPALEQKHSFELPYRRAFDTLGVAMQLYQNNWMNLLMVAPQREHDPYQHLSALPPDSPARLAAADLGRAWRAGDAPGVNLAIRALAERLPTLSPVYPGSRRSLELTYNRSNAFEWGYWIYGLALLALILAFGTERRWLVGVGIAALAAAISLHAFGFVTRCLIAERFAIQNQFESMTGVSLFANVVGAAIMIMRRQWLFGAAAAGVGFLVLMTATQTAIPGAFIEREAAILNTSVLLKYHVTTVLSSYGLISLGFIVSLFYLATHYASRFRAGAPTSGVSKPAEAAVFAPIVAAQALNLAPGEAAGVRRTLHDLDRAQMTILQLAFWTLGVGILLGAWWADHSWGRWWAFDPKETWALLTWIVYLVVIHLRVGSGRYDRGLVTAWMSVLGFVVMCWTYFGVNLLLPGLHAYA